MNYEITSKDIQDTLLYKLLVSGFLLCFLTTGLGNHLFGMELFTDTTTLFIYLIFFIQLLTNSLIFNKYLSYVWIYILIQTFIINYSYIDFLSSIKQFVGLILYSTTVFSFIGKYKNRLLDIVNYYLKSSYLIAYFVIFQTLLFIIFNLSFIPQNFISGHLSYSKNELIPEIFDIIPRAVAVYSEPAHYVSFMLPSLFIALDKLINKRSQLGITNYGSYLIIFTYVISFSLVGYLGLIISLFLLLKKRIFTNFYKTLALLTPFAALIYFILQTSIGNKVYSFINTSKDITGSEYVTGDQSSFALLSNIMVAIQGNKISNGIGTGLNSHIITYNSTISNIFSESQIIAELNKENAGAIFIRLFSEFGIVGLSVFILFLIVFKIKKSKRIDMLLINNLSLVTIIMYCSRTGHYLSITFIFFISLYYYSYKLNKLV